MKQKDYQRAMDSLNAPQGAMQKALCAVRNTEITEDIISKKENKRYGRFPYAAAIAALLALVIGLTAVFGFAGHIVHTPPAQEHSFVIKAGAAEVNTDDYVRVGTMVSRGGGIMLSFDSNVQDGDYVDEWMSYTMLGVTRDFVFDNITCEGNHIAQVTYRTYGATVSHEGEIGSIEEYIGGFFCYQEELGHELISDSDGLRVAEDLPTFNNTGTIFDEDVTTFISFSFFDQTGKYHDEKYIRDYLEEDEDGDLSTQRGIDTDAVFTDMVQDDPTYMYMDVTVSFDDGSSVVRRVNFEVVKEQDGPDYVIEAKLAE